MRQSRKGAANGLRYVRMPLGEAADMHFVNDEVSPFDARTPGRLKHLFCFNDGLRHKGRAIDIVLGRAMDPRVEQIASSLKGRSSRVRERIDQQFGAIETVPGVRFKGAMGAQAVKGAGANARDMPVKHIAQSAGELDPRRLASPPRRKGKRISPRRCLRRQRN